MFSIRTKLLLLILPVTLLMMGGLGYCNYLQQLEAATRSTQAALQSSLEMKQATLIEYMESVEKIGAALANNDTVQSYSGLANRNLSGNNLESVTKLAKRVEKLLYSVQETHWGHYHHIFLANRTNRVVISPGHGAATRGMPSVLLNRDLTRNRWAMSTMQKGTPSVSNYRSWQVDDHAHQVLFYPVRDAGNRIQAIIGIELHIPFQQQIVEKGFSLGSTGRIFMTALNGQHVEQKDIDHLFPISGDALNETKLNGGWAGRRLNAQGHEVFGHYIKNDRYQWILAAEIETAEVFADIHHQQAILGVGLGVVLLILGIFCVLYTNTIDRPLREIVGQVERISRGEFTIEIPDTRRKDDIGSLIGALQQLVFSLQLVGKKLREAKAFKKAS